MGCRFVEPGVRPRDGAGAPRPTRRGWLGSALAAGALAGCSRFDPTSWVTRERYDVDRRFSESMDELAWPRVPHVRAGRAWSMLVISDLHCWPEVPTTLDEVRRSLDRDPVDLVCCLGDLADAGYGQELEAARIGLDALEVPVLTAFGNHDAWHEGWAPFRDLFGPSAYEVHAGGSVLLFLDTAGATLGGLQRPWMEERLAAASGAEHVFVLTHYPLFFGGLGPGNLLGSQQEVYDILDALRRHRVDAHISGHTHIWRSAELDGLGLHTVSSLREEAGDRAGLRVEVDGETVRYLPVPFRAA